MVLLQIQQLHKKQGDFQLSEISLDVSANEVLAILGESGSGKTSLLRLVAGLMKPDRGEILLAGKTLAGSKGWIKPQERPIGLSFQDAWLFPKMTVAENIQVGMKGASKSAKKSQTAEWLALLGLKDFGARFPHELSGGEQQRIALARALATRPKLMLFDEPFSKLDAARRSRLRADVARLLKHTQTAAMIVTHDVEDVYALADRVAIMKDGKMLQVGNVQEVYSQPMNAYVATLFGPANVVSGQQLRDIGIGQIDLKGSYCIRPEQVSWVSSSDENDFVLEERFFYGNKVHLKFSGPKGSWLVFGNSEEEYTGLYKLTVKGYHCFDGGREGGGVEV